MRLIHKYFVIMCHKLKTCFLTIIMFNFIDTATQKRPVFMKFRKAKEKTTECFGHNFVEKYAAYYGLEFPDFVKYLTSTPKYTTIRVNLKNYTPQQVADILRTRLKEKYGESPDVYVHSELPDCVVIAPLHKLSQTVFVQPVEVIVDIPCALAVLRGADVFAPGILGLPHNAKPGTTVGVYADLAKKCLRGHAVEYNLKKCLVANGVLKMSRNELFGHNITQPRGIAVEITSVISQVPNVQVERSLGILQNAPSIIAGHLLDVKPGHKILDMCAAPGNKATHIAMLMNDTGTLIALDKSKLRISKLQESIDELGISCIQPYVFDSTTVNQTSQADIDRMELNENSFDRILLDAPCSGFGQRPVFFETLKTVNEDRKIKSYTVIQKKLIMAAVPLLKSDGILLYCTCSLSIDENEAMMGWMLKKYPELESVQTLPKLGSIPLKHKDLKREDRAIMQRFGPPLSGSDLDTIGFFIAKIRKKYHVPTTVKPRNRKEKDVP